MVPAITYAVATGLISLILCFGELSDFRGDDSAERFGRGHREKTSFSQH